LKVGILSIMRPATAVQLSEEPQVAKVPYSVAAGIEEGENPNDSGVELLKAVSVDVSDKDLKRAEQLVAYLNALADAKLNASDEEGMGLGKLQSRRSVLKDALAAGIARRVLVIEKAAGSPLPDAKDEKAMKAYASRVFEKTDKRS
jgi:hypothetical protein